MTMKFLCATVLLVAAVAWPTGLASAAKLLPPGNSAANQYAQTLPGPDGEEAAAGHEPRAPQKMLGKSTTARMRQLGPDGRAALRLATETATKPVRHRDHRPSHAGAGPGPGGAGGTGAGGSSGLGEVLGRVTGTQASGSLGVLQPMIVLFALVAAGAYALTRRRRTTRDG